jgi:hypothetical protein
MSRDAVLWTAVMIGPLAWMLAFGTQFTLSGWTCGLGSKLPLYVVSVAAMILVAIGIVASFSSWRAMGKSWPGESAGPSVRTNVMALSGIALNAFFLVVLIAQTIPHLMLAGCE